VRVTPRLIVKWTTKDLFVRGLAAGISQLPWAQIKLVAELEPVKGLDVEVSLCNAITS
jgi:hypothetical protein